MIHRPFFLDMTYELMVGKPPNIMLGRREVMAGIIHGWNSERIRTSEEKHCALLSLSCIGIDWHSAARLSYTFEDVVTRFRPLKPDLGEDADIRGVMWDITNPRPSIRHR